MKILIRVISTGLLALSINVHAGKVPVIPGQALSLSGITVPTSTSSAPSPAAPAVTSSVPSISLPTSVTNAVLGESESSQSEKSNNSANQPLLTIAQTLDAVTRFSDAASFSTDQASKAIGLINSVLINAGLTTAESAQLIQLRESLENR